MIQVQIDRGPPVVSAKPNVVKIPVVIEMQENATANDSKCLSERANCCRYPKWGSRASSSGLVTVVMGGITSPAASVLAGCRSGRLSGHVHGHLSALGAQHCDACGLDAGNCVPVVIVGDHGGDLVERAYPVHGDGAELAGIGEHVTRRGMSDDGPPDDDLWRVVVGQPGLRMHAAGAEECLVGVELGEE